MSEHKICDYEGNPIDIDDNVVIVDERGVELDLHPLRELNENAYFLLPSKEEKPELYVFGGLFANKKVSYKKKLSEINKKAGVNSDSYPNKTIQEEFLSAPNKTQESPIDAFLAGGKPQKVDESECQNLIPTIASTQKEKIAQIITANDYQSEFSSDEEQEYYDSLKDNYHYSDNEPSYEYLDDYESENQETEFSETEYSQNEENNLEIRSEYDINDELNAETFPGENINNIISQYKEANINFSTNNDFPSAQIEVGAEIRLETKNSKADILNDNSIDDENIPMENDTKSILDVSKTITDKEKEKKTKKFKVEYDEGYIF